MEKCMDLTNKNLKKTTFSLILPNKKKLFEMTLSKVLWIISALIISGITALITITYENRSDIAAMKAESKVRVELQEKVYNKVESMNFKFTELGINVSEMQQKVNEIGDEVNDKASTLQMENLRFELVTKIDKITTNLQNRKLWGEYRNDSINNQYLIGSK
jgi:hypothetical protein